MTLAAIPRELLVCQTDNGTEPFADWYWGKQLDKVSRARIQAALDRLEDGNFSNVEPVGEGVSELKIDFGPGYRVYFGQHGKEVHLIRGGDKATQSADIAAARHFWRQHE